MLSKESQTQESKRARKHRHLLGMASASRASSDQAELPRASGKRRRLSRPSHQTKRKNEGGGRRGRGGRGEKGSKQAEEKVTAQAVAEMVQSRARCPPPHRWQPENPSRPGIWGTL